LLERAKQPPLRIQ